MPLMNDRPRIEPIPPRPPQRGALQMLPGDPRTIARRAKDPAYAPFWTMVQHHAARARKADLTVAAMHEETRSRAAKALALTHWATGSARDAARAKEALFQAGAGHWTSWCGAGDAILDYLVAADLLRAAGRFDAGDMARLRDRLAPKLTEGFGVAHDLPQNNWRIECDCGVAAAALFFWHDPGPLNVGEMLASGLDGLSRMLFAMLTPDGANEEGNNYSRRAAIPVVRLAWAMRRMTGADLLNREDVLRWHRWQAEIKRPDGRIWPLDDSDDIFEGYPHGLLANPACKDAALHRWAHDRAPFPFPEWAGEAMLVFDARVRPCAPKRNPSYVLAESGMAVFRTGWDRDATMGLLVARPLPAFGADQFNTAHRHDDPTNFLLHAHGRLMVTEAGYGGYCAEGRYAYNLAGTGHNMVLVDGQGPLRVTSHNNDSRRGNTSQSAGRVRELCRTPEIYGAQAVTSYQNVDFRRSVFMVRGRYFVIIDEVEGAKTHEYSWLLHGNSLEMTYAAPDGAHWAIGPTRLAAHVLLPTNAPWRHLKGGGAAKNDAGERIPADHMCLRAWTSGRTARFVSVLVPDKADTPPPQLRVVASEPVAVSIHTGESPTPELFIWKPQGGRARVRGLGAFVLNGPAGVFPLPARRKKKGD